MTDQAVEGAELLPGLVSTWAEIQRGARSTDEWTAQLEVMLARVSALKASHQWLTGPEDLLSIVGLHRWELAHSSALGWLLDPDGSHRLGSSFLDLFAQEIGAPEAAGPVAVTLEEGRDDTRADIVARARDWTLVIEVKVDANEGRRQCQRQFELWSDEPDPFFVFLTPSGRPPESTVTAEAVAAWTALTWRRTGDLLRRAIDNAGGAAPAAEQYAMTLTRLFRSRR